MCCCSRPTENIKAVHPDARPDGHAALEHVTAGHSCMVAYRRGQRQASRRPGDRNLSGGGAWFPRKVIAAAASRSAASRTAADFLLPTVIFSSAKAVAARTATICHISLRPILWYLSALRCGTHFENCFNPFLNDKLMHALPHHRFKHELKEFSLRVARF